MKNKMKEKFVTLHRVIRLPFLPQVNSKLALDLIALSKVEICPPGSTSPKDWIPGVPQSCWWALCAM